MDSSIERFNVKTGEVTVIESRLLIGRNCPALCKVDSDVYILGGDVFENYQDFSSDEELEDDNKAVDKSSGKYLRLTASKLQRMILSYTNHFTRSVEIFNLDCEKITEGKRLPIADEGFTAVVFESENFED